MALLKKTYAEVEKTKESFIDVYKPIAGWKARQMFWDKEGFWDCWQTGFWGHETKEQAQEEAKDWAEAEGIAFIEN